jgi:5-methylcytosine-specific restriction protein A
LNEEEGFLVSVKVEWRRLSVHFKPGKFAAPLLREMSNASEESRKQASSFIRLAEDRGLFLKVTVNGEYQTDLSFAAWPDTWKSMSISGRSKPVDLDHDNEMQVGEKVFDVASIIFGIVVPLLPTEDVDLFEETRTPSLPEGAKKRVEVNRYERSKLNRAACITAKGYACQACGFDFREKYGDIGIEYIHVHHIIPVSELGENYEVDPISDLVPLCPNCHAMVHRRNPPFSINELRLLMENT